MSFLTDTRVDYTNRSRIGIVLLTLLFAACQELQSAPGDLIFPVPNPSPSTDEYFGRTVALTPAGDMLVGSPGSLVGGINAGAVFVFDRITGQFELEIPNPAPLFEDSFGAYVWSSASKIIVGAPGNDTDALTTNTGAVYLFEPVSGALVRTLTSPTPTIGGSFGWSVHAIGENILVGSRDDDTMAENAGAAFLFDGSNGQLLRTFYSPAPTPYDVFGLSVAGVGTKVLIGAPGVDAGATDSGAVYVFDSATGSLLHTIPNPDPAPGVLFGVLVRGYGSDLLVGSVGGGAYLFNGTTGNLIRKFSSPEAGPPTGFGCSLANNGSDIFVGNYTHLAPSGSEGALYVFNAATGAFKRKLVSPQVVGGPVEQKFGVSCVGVGNHVLVSAHFESAASQVHAGAAYLFDSTTPATAADGVWLGMD